MKRFLCVIFSIILFILLTILSINLSVEDIVVSTISDSMVGDKVSDVVMNVIYGKYPDMEVDDLQKIEELVLNSEEVRDIAGTLFSAIISDNNENTIDINKEIGNLIEDNKDKLVEFGISSEDIDNIRDKIVENGDNNYVYEEVKDNVSINLSDEQEMVISIYNILNSNELRYGLIIGIVFSLCVIIFLSGYKAMIYSGISSLVSGIFVRFGIIGIINLIAWNVTNKVLGRTTDINVSALSNIGLLYIIFGIILIIIYFVEKNIYSKKA